MVGVQVPLRAPINVINTIKQQRLEPEYFGTVALALYAIVRPDGSIVKTFPGLTRDADQFLAFLQPFEVAPSP